VAKVLRDESALAETGIRVLRERPVYTTPNVFPPGGFEQADVDEPGFREVAEPQHCYVCKERYLELHPFYDQLCRACGDFNYEKRTETADLSGRVALLTGGRVKIGYQAGIKLLRAGAQLIVTTRFPRDAAGRYAQEADFDDWADRLEIFGLDLRHTPSVEAFCRARPVVASRVGGIPDLVQDESNGLLVEPGDTEGLADALVRVLDDRPLAERLGAGAHSSADLWTVSPEDFASRLRDLVGRITGLS